MILHTDWKDIIIYPWLIYYQCGIQLFQGFIMTGITQKICYRMRKEISEKNQPYADEIF